MHHVDFRRISGDLSGTAVALFTITMRNFECITDKLHTVTGGAQHHHRRRTHHRHEPSERQIVHALQKRTTGPASGAFAQAPNPGDVQPMACKAIAGIPGMKLCADAGAPVSLKSLIPQTPDAGQE